MDKNAKKELLKQYKERKKQELLSSLPMPIDGFKALFDYLDASDQECEHDFAMTLSFLERNCYPVDEVLEWLQNHGAGCDCEILFNIEEQFDNFLE